MIDKYAVIWVGGGQATGIEILRLDSGGKSSQTQS